MLTISRSPVAVSAPADPAQVRKITRGAQQFEAMLLNTLLAPLEKAFASLPGGQDDPGSGSYQSLGTEALATALASSGGLGIASMITHNLLKSSQLSGGDKQLGAKVSDPFADRNSEVK